VTVIPQAPGPEFVFTPPPSWNAPAGFDPRRGHLVDPVWPPAPDGWQFWNQPVIPPATRFMSRLNSVGKVRIVIGVLAVLFVLSRFFGVFGGGPPTGLGSCWKGADGSKYTPVDCSDSSAQYKVNAEESDPALCPPPADSYLDSKKDGASRYKCLVPISG
jgi:hypothetical protein